MDFKQAEKMCVLYRKEQQQQQEHQQQQPQHAKLWFIVQNSYERIS